jgi:hypothetical protein
VNANVATLLSIALGRDVTKEIGAVDEIRQAVVSGLNAKERNYLLGNWEVAGLFFRSEEGKIAIQTLISDCMAWHKRVTSQVPDEVSE